MAENEKAQSSEIKTNEEREMPRKPNGIMIKKINEKTFVTEIYFDKNSKETFQNKLFKVVHSERNK